MNNSRQIILNNIRNGMKSSLLPDADPVKPSIKISLTNGDLAMFVAELRKLSCEVIQTATPEGAVEELVQIFMRRQWSRTLIWESLLKDMPGLFSSLHQHSIECVSGSDKKNISEVSVGITGCQAAIADTGTVVLQNITGQPAYVSLLPEVHVVLVDARLVHANLQAYLSSLPSPGQMVSASNNLVFITGPSRTGDIELSLTLGVHGPREVIVILWGEMPLS